MAGNTPSIQLKTQLSAQRCRSADDHMIVIGCAFIGTKTKSCIEIVMAENVSSRAHTRRFCSHCNCHVSKSTWYNHLSLGMDTIDGGKSNPECIVHDSDLSYRNFFLVLSLDSPCVLLSSNCQTQILQKIMY